MKSKNKLLVLVSAYSIIASVIVLLYYLKNTLLSFNQISLGSIIINVLMILIFGALFLSNIYLLADKGNKKISLKYNIVIYLLQIFHINILGFIYEFSSGIEIIPYFLIKNKLNFGVKYDLWNILLTLYYRNNMNGFLIGLNLISILLFISYIRIYKRKKFLQVHNYSSNLCLDFCLLTNNFQFFLTIKKNETKKSPANILSYAVKRAEQFSKLSG